MEPFSAAFFSPPAAAAASAALRFFSATCSSAGVTRERAAQGRAEGVNRQLLG